MLRLVGSRHNSSAEKAEASADSIHLDMKSQQISKGDHDHARGWDCKCLSFLASAAFFRHASWGLFRL